MKDYINEMEWEGFSNGTNTIKKIRINCVKMDNEKRYNNPTLVEGEVLIESNIRYGYVPFKYSGGLISIDLEEDFIFSALERESFINHLAKICKRSTICIGDEYIHFTLMQLLGRICLWFFMGVFFAMGVSIIIKG